MARAAALEHPMVKVLAVIAIGVAVGVAIELALAWRQRSRRVVLDEPDLPPGIAFERDRPPRRRRRRRPPIEARDATVVFDDDGGFRILGPVAYDDALARPWDGGAGATGADH